MYAANQIEDEELKAKLPKPTGYHILIAVPEMSTKTDGGVIMPDALVKQEETASIIGYVLAIGPEAYGDKEKFSSGPYCAVGDFIIFRSYSGTRFKVMGKEFRLINDDTVEAVVEDPRGYSRALVNTKMTQMSIWMTTMRLILKLRTIPRKKTVVVPVELSLKKPTFPKKGMILILKSTASLCKSALKSLNLSIMKNGVGKKRQTESVKRHFSTRIRLKARTNGFAKT